MPSRAVSSKAGVVERGMSRPNKTALFPHPNFGDGSVHFFEIDQLPTFRVSVMVKT